MTPIDILFWFLVILMGGVCWAVEAGLVQRYRAALSACVLAALGSGIFIMFWIEDKTSIEYEKVGPMVKKKGGGGGGSEVEVIEEETKGGRSRDGKSRNKDAAPKGDGGDIVVDMRQQVFSRAPFKDCPECPDVVIVPEGEFTFGSPPDEVGRAADEAARTEARIAKPFAIGRLELLRSEFQAFVTDAKFVSATQCDLGKRRGKFNWQAPGFEQDPRHPVACLSITDVEAYLQWLSTKTERQYRLPTEQEWEAAARAKSNTPYWNGDTLLKHQGNFGRSRDGTTPAGSFEANDFGLSDMAGSLAELTADCKTGPGGTPTVPCDRIVKGGAWNAPVGAARHAARSWHVDGTATNFIGIRVARAIDERDNDKVLTAAQRVAIIKDERAAAEIRAREATELDKSKREAREAAAKAVEVTAFTKSEREKMSRERVANKAKSDLEAFEASKKPPVPGKK